MEELQIEKMNLSFECIPYFMSFPFSTRLFNSPSILSFSECQLSTQTNVRNLFNALLRALWKSNETIQIRLTTPDDKNHEIPRMESNQMEEYHCSSKQQRKNNNQTSVTFTKQSTNSSPFLWKTKINPF